MPKENLNKIKCKILGKFNCEVLYLELKNYVGTIAREVYDSWMHSSR